MLKISYTLWNAASSGLSIDLGQYVSVSINALIASPAPDGSILMAVQAWKPDIQRYRTLMTGLDDGFKTNHVINQYSWSILKFGHGLRLSQI